MHPDNKTISLRSVWVVALCSCCLLCSCSGLKNILSSGQNLPVDEVNSLNSKTDAPNTNAPLPKDEKGDSKYSENIYQKGRKKKSIVSNSKNIPHKQLAVIQEAEKLLGTPYVWGGTSARGVDCSGLMLLAFQKVDYKIPRVANDQAKLGVTIPKNELQAGDLLFFASSRKDVIGHVGLVVGVESTKVKFIHAALSGVRYDYLHDPHWTQKFILARRYNLQ